MFVQFLMRRINQIYNKEPKGQLQISTTVD